MPSIPLPPPTPARAAVRALLRESAEATWRRIGPVPGAVPGEVDFLYGLFNVAVRGLDRALAPAPSAFGWSSTTRGIFVHGRPHVAFDAALSPGGCEIGDLLIVVHQNDLTRPAGNALLLQSKIGPFPFGATSKERVQWWLYHEWPEFWWRHRFAYRRLGGDGRRHVKPGQPHPGAQYLAINPRSPASAEFQVGLTAPGRSAGVSSVDFADAIVDTILRVCGRRFCDQAKAGRRIGWDRVIWDLLETWTYSSLRQRLARYSGFAAERIGPTPPALLVDIAGQAAQDLWNALPEPTSNADVPPSIVELADSDLPDPLLPISTIFVALGPDVQG